MQSTVTIRPMHTHPAQPPWWPSAREQALQSTRMLSLVMLLGLASWTLILVAAVVWYPR